MVRHAELWEMPLPELTPEEQAALGSIDIEKRDLASRMGAGWREKGGTGWRPCVQQIWNAAGFDIGFAEADYQAWCEWASHGNPAFEDAWKYIEALPEAHIQACYRLCREACYQVAP